jgi:hypothetical protein
MPRIKKTSPKSRAKASKGTEIVAEEIELGRQVEYGSRRTTPRSAARRSSAVRGASKGGVKVKTGVKVRKAAKRTSTTAAKARKSKRSKASSRARSR